MHGCSRWFIWWYKFLHETSGGFFLSHIIRDIDIGASDKPIRWIKVGTIAENLIGDPWVKVVCRVHTVPKDVGVRIVADKCTTRTKIWVIKAIRKLRPSTATCIESINEACYLQVHSLLKNNAVTHFNLHSLLKNNAMVSLKILVNIWPTKYFSVPQNMDMSTIIVCKEECGISVHSPKAFHLTK